MAPEAGLVTVVLDPSVVMATPGGPETLTWS